jgi:NAD(P)-dependent dehydrogenase (short-subunit alcohol dehydrogenase family)
MTSFANRVALITGAGRGIGRQLALDLAAEGAVIAALDLDADALTALADVIAPKPVAWAVADVTDRTSLQPAIAELQAKLGPIDLLIANAGVACENSALSFSAADFERQIRVNLIGVANSVEAVLPGMIERRRGQLVGISSLASLRGLPRMAGYCASKAGVNALMDTLRVELAPLGITVTTICPGWIRTAMTRDVQASLPDILEVTEAVQQIITAVRAGRPMHGFPRHSYWRCRLLRWLPATWSDGLVRRMLAARLRK